MQNGAVHQQDLWPGGEVSVTHLHHQMMNVRNKFDFLPLVTEHQCGASVVIPLSNKGVGEVLSLGIGAFIFPVPSFLAQNTSVSFCSTSLINCSTLSVPAVLMGLHLWCASFRLIAEIFLHLTCTHVTDTAPSAPFRIMGVCLFARTVSPEPFSHWPLNVGHEFLPADSYTICREGNLNLGAVWILCTAQSRRNLRTRLVVPKPGWNVTDPFFCAASVNRIGFVLTSVAVGKLSLDVRLPDQVDMKHSHKQEIACIHGNNILQMPGSFWGQTSTCAPEGFGLNSKAKEGRSVGHISSFPRWYCPNTDRCHQSLYHVCGDTISECFYSVQMCVIFRRRNCRSWPDILKAASQKPCEG